MRSFRLTALLAAVCLLSACATTAPRGKTIGGTALAVTGVVVAAHRADSHCEPQSDLCDALLADPINATADAFTTVLGIGMVVLGAGLLIDGMSDFQKEHDAEQVERTQILQRAPAPVAEASPAEQLPATNVILDRVENRLAVQASVIARSGNCTSAMATANELAKRDHEMYVKLLAADVGLHDCYRAQLAP